MHGKRQCFHVLALKLVPFFSSPPIHLQWLRVETLARSYSFSESSKSLSALVLLAAA
jgi:hypothetical protein